LNFDTDDVAAYVVAGAVVPLNLLGESSAILSSTLVLAVVPGADEGDVDYYEDDGESLGYQQGQYSVTHVVQRTSGNVTVINIVPKSAGNSYPGAPATKQYRIQLRRGGIPSQITCNGITVPFSQNQTIPGYWNSVVDDNLEVVEIGLLPFSSSDSIRVVADFSPS